MTGPEVLAVEGLEVAFATAQGWTSVVHDVGFSVGAGRTLGLVGESGCGKSVTGLSVMGLLPQTGARVVGGRVRLDGTDLLGLGEGAMSSVRGNRIAMIFQEPMTSLDPAFTVGDQIAEAVRRHRGLARRPAWDRAVEMLGLVGLPLPARRARDYPHAYSGGMRQRAMIAMALACEPSVLIADEPTTALDVTTQAQILELLKDLQGRFGMAIVMITHDLGVVADICDDVTVMYAGQVVESAPAEELFHRPRHPYTAALLACMPGEHVVGRLPSIPGTVPPPTHFPAGCRFHPRCTFAQEPRCTAAGIPLLPVGAAHCARCVRVSELHLAGAGGDA